MFSNVDFKKGQKVSTVVLVIFIIFGVFFIVFCIREINFKRMEKEVRSEMSNMLKPAGKIAEPSEFAIAFQEKTKDMDPTSEEYKKLSEAMVRNEMSNVLKPKDRNEILSEKNENQEQLKGLNPTSEEYKKLSEAMVRNEMSNALRPSSTKVEMTSDGSQKKNNFFKSFFGFY